MEQEHAKTSHIIALAFLFMLMAIGVWDVFTTVSPVRYKTVSDTLSTWAKDYPIMALAIGMILGHIFWK